MKKLILSLMLVLLSATASLAQEACRVQRALADKGFYHGEIDCALGPNTRQAIRAFQREKGLHVDGQIGEDTRCRLLGSCRSNETPSADDYRPESTDNDDGFEPVAEDENANPNRVCKDQAVEAESDGRPLLRFARGNAREEWSSTVDSRFGAEWARTKNARNLRMKCFESSGEGDIVTIWKCRLRAIPCSQN